MPILDRARAAEMAQVYRSRYKHMTDSQSVEDQANAPAAAFAAEVWASLASDLAERRAVQDSLARRPSVPGESVAGPDEEDIDPAVYPARLQDLWDAYSTTFILPEDEAGSADFELFAGATGLVRADGAPLGPAEPAARPRRLLAEELRPFVHPGYIDSYVDEMRTVLRIQGEDFDDGSTLHRLQRPTAAPAVVYEATLLPPVQTAGTEGPVGRWMREDGRLAAADARALGLHVATESEIEEAARRPKQRESFAHRLVGPADQVPPTGPARGVGRGTRTAPAGGVEP